MGLDVTGQYRYPPPDPEWLALSRESVLEPELPIVDTHHHLWEQHDEPYLLQAFEEDLRDGHNVVASVCVEAHYGYRTEGPDSLAPVGETEKIMAMRSAARQNSAPILVAEGIVAKADLSLGEAVDEVLDAHEALAGEALVGIRHSVSRDENFPDGIVLRPGPAALLGDPDYRKGLSRLATRGLTYDAMLYHQQLPELTAMARATPDLQIVLDHIGSIIGVGPYELCEEEVRKAWALDMQDLAQCPNVSVKIGGFGMIIGGAKWHLAESPPSSERLANAWRPYVETCIDLFGPQRCMFESNFPVDKAMYSYRTLWNAFKRLAQQYSMDEKEALFLGSARQAYRLGEVTAPVSADG
ncbi:amidohydrolase family protein [Erythrobacter sp. EC-HK427]|uniref:amidohydrolase family protein n=1 Tax=Erythrobacter sp. EC-HK427 TaxID=2038396 RepID=UPI001258863D|nr:amidohydrolase family protein [Erythrobacter sp. EC-HK427]VVT10363.1 Amidohydrolase 2 [Erythrobacter sp. EC-HK427]